MKEKAFIVLNSTVFYVSAFILTTFFHELSHFFAGLLYESEPVLHHNYVEHFRVDHLTAAQEIQIALAGPLLSLIQGIIFGWIFLKFKDRGNFSLFLMWFSVLGFINFLGYLMTGPLFSFGDIGKVYQISDTPVWIQITFALLGALALLFIAYKLTRPILEFSYKEEWVADSASRKRLSFLILILPWLIGSAIMTILYLPVIAIISIIYPVMSGFVFIFPWQNSDGAENIRLSAYNNIGKLSIISLTILIILIIGFKLILAPGISV